MRRIFGSKNSDELATHLGLRTTIIASLHQSLALSRIFGPEKGKITGK
jgi:hypothetical protein